MINENISNCSLNPNLWLWALFITVLQARLKTSIVNGTPKPNQTPIEKTYVYLLFFFFQNLPLPNWWTSTSTTHFQYHSKKTLFVSVSKKLHLRYAQIRLRRKHPQTPPQRDPIRAPTHHSHPGFFFLWLGKQIKVKKKKNVNGFVWFLRKWKFIVALIIIFELELGFAPFHFD